MKTWVQTWDNQRQLEEWLHALISLQSFIKVFRSRKSPYIWGYAATLHWFWSSPKMHACIYTVYSLYIILRVYLYIYLLIFFNNFFFKDLYIHCVSIPKHKDRLSRSSVSIWAPGLRRTWQSCLGFILMQKEEALAASTRWPLTAFVSKFTKKEMDRVGKRGKEELRFVTHKERQMERWEDNREERDRWTATGKRK